MKFEVRSAKFEVRSLLLGLAVAVSLATAGVMAQQAPDRSKIPEPGAPPALKLPPIQKRTLANGLPVWIVEMHEVPVVNLTMVVKAGAAADPNGKYGLASFTAAMLDEGAGSKSALELADAVEFLGAGLASDLDIPLLRGLWRSHRVAHGDDRGGQLRDLHHPRSRDAQPAERKPALGKPGAGRTRR